MSNDVNNSSSHGSSPGFGVREGEGGGGDEGVVINCVLSSLVFIFV